MRSCTRFTKAVGELRQGDPRREDTNLGRRLTPVGRIALSRACWVWTSARRYHAIGTAAVFNLYVRNFWSEILRHRPADTDHLDVRA